MTNATASIVPDPQSLTLRDGRNYVLRPLGLADAQKLREFFYSHTPETIYRRYGFIVRDMTQQRAHHLVGVDQTRDLALAVFEPMPDGSERIDAVGRFFLDPDGTTGEFALVVREDRRRLGLASLLLRELRKTADIRGMRGLWGQVDRDNLPMVAMLRRLRASPQPPHGVGPDEGGAPAAAVVWWLPCESATGKSD